MEIKLDSGTPFLLSSHFVILMDRPITLLFGITTRTVVLSLS